MARVCALTGGLPEGFYSPYVIPLRQETAGG